MRIEDCLCCGRQGARAPYLKETEEGPVVVTRNGKVVAVLLAVTDDDELERLVLAHSPKFQALLDKSATKSTKPAASRTSNSGGR